MERRIYFNEVEDTSNYIVGSVVSYLLNKNFTFENKSDNRKVPFKFVINITLCYLIAYGLAKPFVGYVLEQYAENVRDNISMLVGMSLFVVFNYLGQRFFVFNQNRNKE